MRQIRPSGKILLAVCLALPGVLFSGWSILAQQMPTSDPEAYLSWSAAQAVAIGKSMRVNGRVGGIFDFRVVHTERSFNFKLRATWLTPEVIRASARLEQLRRRLSPEQTRTLVAEAEATGDTVVLVEIDPREGSGIIPLDWQAYLQPKGLKTAESASVIGTNNSELREIKALAGAAERDYAYDLFWVVFPLLDEKNEPIFSDSIKEAELVVRIYNKAGRVSWPIPDSIRELASALKQKKEGKLNAYFRSESQGLRKLVLRTLQGHGLTSGVVIMYIVPPKSKAVLPESTSSVHINEKQPAFEIHLPEDLTINRFILLRMEQKEDRREIEVEVLPRFVYPDIKPKATSIPIRTREIQQQVHEVLPEDPLSEGEYFIYISGSAVRAKQIFGKGFDFTIE